MSEQWRHIPGASMYEVSDIGRVRSYFKTNGLPIPHVVEGTPRNGYWRVRLIADDGSRRFRVVHRLVAETFLDAPSDESHRVVRHLDDDKTNNHVSNLAWGTQAENVADTLRNGHHAQAARTHCGRGHLFDEGNTYRRPDGARTCRACKTHDQRARRAHNRNLLDVQVEGVAVRDLVTQRLAELEAGA